MLLTLSVISAQGGELGAEAYKVFDSSGGTIGRVEGNYWILPDPDKVVSGRHARVFMQGGAFYIEDLSTNGTFLNSTSVALERARPAELRDGDRLHIGDYEILVQMIDDAPTAASAEPALPRGFELSPPPAQAPHAAPAAAFAPWETPVEQAAPPFAEAPAAVWSPPVAAPARAAHRDPPPDLREAANAALDPLAALEARGGAPLLRAAPAPRAAPPPPAAAGLIPENWDNTSYNVQRAPSAAAEPPPALPPRAPLPAAVRPAPSYQPSPIATPPPASSAPNVRLPAVGSEPVLAALCAELGLDASQLDANGARQMGVILRLVVQGLINLLQVRSEVKNNFRMPLTSIRPIENNPLKLSLDARDALHNLFVKRNPGYLPPTEAFQEAFQDVEFHQLAMLAGIRAGFNAMIARMTPDHLEEGYARRLKRTALLGVTMKSKYWELYREFFEDIERDPEASFQNLFGEEFAKAYHAQIQSLGTSSRHRGR